MCPHTLPSLLTVGNVPGHLMSMLSLCHPPHFYSFLLSLFPSPSIVLGLLRPSSLFTSIVTLTPGSVFKSNKGDMFSYTPAPYRVASNQVCFLCSFWSDSLLLHLPSLLFDPVLFSLRDLDGNFLLSSVFVSSYPRFLLWLPP